MIRLGYSEDCIDNSGVDITDKELKVLYSEAVQNIEYIYNIIKSNLESGALVYEIITETFPNITNFSLINSDDYSDLAYSMSYFTEILIHLGGFINKSKNTILFRELQM